MSQAEQPQKKSHLTLWICIAIAAAIALALLNPKFAMSLELGGDVFLRLLKMMVVPLVVASVMSGILGMGDIRKLGRPGGRAILYYLSTTVLAVIVGLVVVNVIRPGVGTIDKETREKAAAEGSTDKAKKAIRDSIAETAGLTPAEVAKVFDELPAPGEKDVWTILRNLVLMLFTDNLISSAADADLLPLIIFSIIFAGMLTTLGTKVDNITTIVEEINHALMAFVMLLMKVAPLGIFCLVAASFGEAADVPEGSDKTPFQAFSEQLGLVGWYMATVLLGLAIHAFVTLPLILWVFTRRNPYRFMYQMSQSLLTAFSTASSSASLPVTMECAIEKAGIDRKSTEFVLPLGATINMDGTALYEAAAAIFIAQVYMQVNPDYELTIMKQVIIAVTATLAAIGAAGIPQAGLVTMLIVLHAVNLPLEYIGLILSVDWLLDRFRTAVNVFGDSIGAAVVEKVIPKDA